jgi:methionyl-tRNA formyltransferase
MKTLAEQAGVPVFQPEKINQPEGLAALARLEPDLLVVAAYGQILKPSVLEIPIRGAINVHASLLPKYRGASPIAHALLQGERETGVTIIRIEPGLDAGAMLAQEAVTIAPHETTGELEARLAVLGARLCSQVVEQINAGTAVGTPQDPNLVTRAPKFTKEQGEIPWSRPAQQIAWHVQAMQPWPTPYTHLHRAGKDPLRLILLKVHVLAEQTALPPGAVHPQPGKLQIACGEGTMLEIEELQPAGKKRQTAAEFLRGYPVSSGDVFS